MGKEGDTSLRETLRERVEEVKTKLSSKLEEKGLKGGPPAHPAECRAACGKLLHTIFFGSPSPPPALLVAEEEEEEGFTFKVTPKGEIQIKGSPFQAMTRPFISGVEQLVTSVTSNLQDACEAACTHPEFGPKLFPANITRCLADAQTPSQVQKCVPDLDRFLEYAMIAEEISGLERRVDEL
ncbi:hypothetical protein SpCBS45565_g08132 [Spizellomyces sp. 'palustris']|nr:hypothetical protein SpCBS45565_g08132 [Spizellomyces sp. 'palustris']